MIFMIFVNNSNKKIDIYNEYTIKSIMILIYLMNSYNMNNILIIKTSNGKSIPYLKSVLTGCSDVVESMIKNNELVLNFHDKAVMAFLTWLDKTTINKNHFITHYTKSIEESAKDKAEMVKVAQHLKMNEPEMMFDFIYESFCDCNSTDEYNNKDITSNDFSMYGAKQNGNIYNYSFCLIMLQSISYIKKLANERLTTPNYEEMFSKMVLDKFRYDMMNKIKETPDEQYFTVNTKKKEAKTDLFDEIVIKS